MQHQKRPPIRHLKQIPLLFLISSTHDVYVAQQHTEHSPHVAQH